MDNNDLLIIAGKGEYPVKLFEGARKAGVGRIGILAFHGQTDKTLCKKADVSAVFGIGELKAVQKWIASSGFKNCVLAGQISPRALFSSRFDSEAAALLKSLKTKCAHSIFGELISRLSRLGLTIIPASSYMDDAIPKAGVLTNRAPSPCELDDIRRGMSAAMTIGIVDIGQTVVVKDGMVLAVEAFEGTNEAIKRGGKLGGKGAVVVKVARDGHDMRFDIPVIGPGTIKRLIKSKVTALAFQAERLILLDREEVLRLANAKNIAIIAIDSGLQPAPLRP